MHAKKLVVAIGSAMALAYAGYSAAGIGPPGQAGPPWGDGPPGLLKPPGTPAAPNPPGPPPFNPLDPPGDFMCEYTANGVTATWTENEPEACGPKYGGDLNLDVIYMVDCAEDGPDPAGTYRIEFGLDTDPEAVWHFACNARSCQADASWEDLNAAIELEMNALFASWCAPHAVVAGAGTAWMLSEDSSSGFYDGIFADVKALCPGQFRGPQRHLKMGDACESAGS